MSEPASFDPSPTAVLSSRYIPWRNRLPRIEALAAAAVILLAMCGRGGSRRLLAKDHPGRAEPIRDHAKAFGKEGLSHRHAHRPALGEGVIDTRPRFKAPMTLVVMPDECQSIPITAPKDWNQKG